MGRRRKNQGGDESAPALAERLLRKLEQRQREFETARIQTGAIILALRRYLETLAANGQLPITFVGELQEPGNGSTTERR